jgi:hypothetical protein
MKVETQHAKGCVPPFAIFVVMFSCYQVLPPVTKCPVPFLRTEKTLGRLNNFCRSARDVCVPFDMWNGCLSGHGLWTGSASDAGFQNRSFLLL